MKKQLTVGNMAPTGTVIDTADEAVDLASLWADGPTFLTFLRHFG